MKLLRIDEALEKCEEHLSYSSAYGTEIESLLTYSLLVLMCSEFEQVIEKLVQDKCSTITDPGIKEFLGSCVGILFRSVKSSEISGLLNRFGNSYKEAFKLKTDNNARAVTLYNNIVTKRHGVAHSYGTNITFQEVKQFYEEGHIVLDFFQDVLLSKGTPTSCLEGPSA